MTAHQWIDIEEIKIENLKNYLETMKSQNYTIVGIEQTSESCKLNEFKFPKKSVILLGNEKEGIPVELIQLLDVCVEIPQTGLIRSLNVHVTGAIIVWEYVRQQMAWNTKSFLINFGKISINGFLVDLKTLKEHFEINWPLYIISNSLANHSVE